MMIAFRITVIVAILFAEYATALRGFCDIPSVDSRFDCHPQQSNVTRESCLERGCCWIPDDSAAPPCVFPIDFPSYNVKAVKNSDFGLDIFLIRDSPTFLPDEVHELRAEVRYYSRMTVRVKIYDPSVPRFEVPFNPPPTINITQFPPDVNIKINYEPFAFVVEQNQNVQLFQTVPSVPLLFADQFLQVSAKLFSPYLYGLGEHRFDFQINASRGFEKRTYWTSEGGGGRPVGDANLLSSQPVFLQSVILNGTQHSLAVMLLNSNAMETITQPLPAITFRTIGGILDFFFIYSNTPQSVVQEYMSLVGLPFLPPYWALGYHLSRYGYMNDDEVERVILRNRALGLPYDVQWGDVDYMDNMRDWTYSNTTYKHLPDIVKDLHDHHQKYVIIVDHAISNSKLDYQPYLDGLVLDVFITNISGGFFQGDLWFGSAVFPDFSHPNALTWNYQQAKRFHDQVPYDGFWLDVNEPYNTDDPSNTRCTGARWDRPYYSPPVIDQFLYGHTVCPSAGQYLSKHYDLHNLYGHQHAIISRRTLDKVIGKRNFLTTRSTFIGSGAYTAHWSGDVVSSWEDMSYSIPNMLNFNLYGVVMSSTDVCGFNGDVTPELCARWHQLGAFYPYMRNQNDKGQKEQDPAVFSSDIQQIIKSAVELRYTFLPYLYTLYYRAHVSGATIVTPYFFVCPHDEATYSIAEQFFVGEALLVSPVLAPGITNISAYFCAGKAFYDIQNTSVILGRGVWETLLTPLDTIKVHLIEGKIIPLQDPAVTTYYARQRPFTLFITMPIQDSTQKYHKKHSALQNMTCVSEGDLFWDDGETFDTIELKKYNYFKFCATPNYLNITIVQYGYQTDMILGRVVVFGVHAPGKSAKVVSQVLNGSVGIKRKHLHGQSHMIIIENLYVPMTQNMTISW